MIGDKSFTCTAEEIALLDIKLNLSELAVKSWQSLEKKKTTYINKLLCDWMEQYIYCSNGPVNAIGKYIEEHKEIRLPSCVLSC